MHRRSILWAAASAFGAAVASRAGAASEAPRSAKLKVVYHLADLDKVSFVLGNIQNHLDGAAAPTMSRSRWSFMARRSAPSMRPRLIPSFPDASVNSPGQ